MTVTILTGDCRDVLDTLPDGHFQTVVTSPPYFGLRDYGHPDQMGLEPTPDEFVAALVEVFRKVRRVLRDDGTVWLNIGDSYASSPPGNKTKGVSAKSGLNGVNGASGAYRETLASGHATKRDTSKIDGLKQKDLIGIPWRVAFALQADGWYLRQDIIWAKPNPMPESVTDRCTKAHEYVFLLSKAPRYFYDAKAVAEEADLSRAGKVERTFSTSDPSMSLRQDVGREVLRTETRNRRSVWTIATQPFREAHYAVMPPDLAEVCIRAGSKPGDHVLDPFGGAGTTGLVADRLQRSATLIELNPANVQMARNRVSGDAGLFAEVAAE